MRRIGLAVVLSLSVLLAAPAAEAQQPKVPRIGFLRAGLRRPDTQAVNPSRGRHFRLPRPRDPNTGRFVEGHIGIGGRPEGSKDQFPRNSYKAMRELIGGRILKNVKDEQGKDVQRSAAEIMADAILEGMQGKLIISQTDKGVTYAYPLHAVKLYQDFMIKSREPALKVQPSRWRPLLHPRTYAIPNRQRPDQAVARRTANLFGSMLNTSRRWIN
jgi:hypothetical protein